MRRGDEILLVHQGLPGGERFWSLPGGVLEDGELVTEGLAREVLEETGVEVVGRPRLAFVLQVDNRRREALRRGRDDETGHLATVWTFEVDEWGGEVEARDPDGVVSSAAFVPAAEAIEQLEAVAWQSLSVRYLRGELERGSLHLQRWHEDGTVETLRST